MDATNEDGIDGDDGINFASDVAGIEIIIEINRSCDERGRLLLADELELDEIEDPEAVDDALFEIETEEGMERHVNDFLATGNIEPCFLGPRLRQCFRWKLHGLPLAKAPKKVTLFDDESQMGCVHINQRQSHFVSDLLRKCCIRDVKFCNTHEHTVVIDALRTIPTIQTICFDSDNHCQESLHWTYLLADLKVKELEFELQYRERHDRWQGPLFPFEKQLAYGNIEYLERLVDSRLKAVYDFGAFLKALCPCKNLRILKIAASQMRLDSDVSFAQFMSTLLNNHPLLEEAALFFSGGGDTDYEFPFERLDKDTHIFAGWEGFAAAAARHKHIRSIELPMRDEHASLLPPIIDAWAAKGDSVGYLRLGHHFSWKSYKIPNISKLPCSTFQKTTAS